MDGMGDIDPALARLPMSMRSGTSGSFIPIPRGRVNTDTVGGQCNDVFSAQGRENRGHAAGAAPMTTGRQDGGYIAGARDLQDEGSLSGASSITRVAGFAEGATAPMAQGGQSRGRPAGDTATAQDGQGGGCTPGASPTAITSLEKVGRPRRQQLAALESYPMASGQVPANRSGPSFLNPSPGTERELEGPDGAQYMGLQRSSASDEAQKKALEQISGSHQAGVVGAELGSGASMAWNTGLESDSGPGSRQQGVSAATMPVYRWGAREQGAEGSMPPGVDTADGPLPQQDGGAFTASNGGRPSLGHAAKAGSSTPKPSLHTEGAAAPGHRHEYLGGWELSPDFAEGPHSREWRQQHSSRPGQGSGDGPAPEAPHQYNAGGRNVIRDEEHHKPGPGSADGRDGRAWGAGRSASGTQGGSDVADPETIMLRTPGLRGATPPPTNGKDSPAWGLGTSRFRPRPGLFHSAEGTHRCSRLKHPQVDFSYSRDGLQSSRDIWDPLTGEKRRASRGSAPSGVP